MSLERIAQVLVGQNVECRRRARKWGFALLAGGRLDGPLVRRRQLSYTMNVAGFGQARRPEMQRVHAVVSCGESIAALQACGESATLEVHSACGALRESTPLPQNASCRHSNRRAVAVSFERTDSSHGTPRAGLSDSRDGRARDEDDGKIS